MTDDITEEVPVVVYDVTEHVATCTQPIPLCYTCSVHFNLKEYN